MASRCRRLCSRRSESRGLTDALAQRKLHDAAAQSEHKRNDAFGASLIIRIPLGELLQHQFFFVAKFNPETRKH